MNKFLALVWLSTTRLAADRRSRLGQDESRPAAKPADDGAGN